MSDFVSILDIIEKGDTFQLRAIKDEMATLDLAIRRWMNIGLVPEEMKKATAERQAVQAASIILNDLSK